MFVDYLVILIWSLHGVCVCVTEDQNKANRSSVMESNTQESLTKAVEADTNGSNEESLKKKILMENKKMWVVAGPAIFTRFSTFGINVISQAFVGHIGATELAAYALVLTLLTRFANGLLVIS